MGKEKTADDTGLEERIAALESGLARLDAFFVDPSPEGRTLAERLSSLEAGLALTNTLILGLDKPADDTSIHVRFGLLEQGVTRTNLLLMNLADALVNGHSLRDFAPIADLFPSSPDKGSPETETTRGVAE